jgi:hypothetical protein
MKACKSSLEHRSGQANKGLNRLALVPSRKKGGPKTSAEEAGNLFDSGKSSISRTKRSWKSRGRFLAEALGRLVGENLPVANVNHAMSVFGNVGLVCDQHDGVAAGVQCIE